MKILLIEDSADDALLLEHHLAAAELHPEVVRVETALAMSRALERESFDLAISDYNVPGFGARAALKLVQDAGRDLPFIIVSGAVGEETAVEMMRAGACDYMMKGDLRRLVPAIRRELEQAAFRRKQRETESLLREMQERFQATFEQVAVGVAHIDPGGRILDVNEKLGEMLGCTPADLVGSEIYDWILAAERDSSRRSFEKLICGDATTYHGERTLIRRDGAPLDVMSTSSVVLDDAGESKYVIAIIQDISERKRAEKSAERLAVLVQQAAEMILVTDTEGVIEYVNPAFERITGFTMEEAVGTRPETLLSIEPDAALDAELWSTLRSGEVFHGRFVNARKDGTVLHEDVTISPVRDASGAIVNYVAIKRDVTKEMELAEQLRHAQKIEAVGTLAGGVAHDFNNLLQGMLTIVEILQRHHDRAREPQHLLDLADAIRRGAQLSRQLLLFARREATRRERVNLDESLRDLVKFLRRVVRENIELTISPSATDAWIEADRGQIDQVIVNLVINAVDAIPDGGAISIHTAGDGPDTVLIEVADTGTGIPDAIRDRIFEPFFTTKESGKGTGLGLSVVHGIVTSHGGRINVESSPAGTLFRVSLPLLHEIPEEDRAAAASPTTYGSGERILLIEDEAGVREGLTGILEILGYEVTAARTAEEALAVETPESFAAVLTDFILPGMTGVDAIRRLRARCPRLCAILMSGYAPPDVIDSAVRAGEFHLLQKPFDMDDLARTLSLALDRALQASVR